MAAADLLLSLQSLTRIARVHCQTLGSSHPLQAWALTPCVELVQPSPTPCTPGDGWTSRYEDAILHGCIPVAIMDNVKPILSNIIDEADVSSEAWGSGRQHW